MELLTVSTKILILFVKVIIVIPSLKVISSSGVSLCTLVHTKYFGRIVLFSEYKMGV